MEPYITVAVNAGQALATGAADYVAREQARRTRSALVAVALVLLAVIVFRKR